MKVPTPIVASFTSSGHAGTVIDTRVYDNGGRMTSSTYNNGVSESRAYNTDNTLTSITFAGAAIGNLTYGWDSNHNKTSEAISGTMSNYGFTIPAGGYDAEDRLVSFTRTAGLTQAWNLSPVGDWNSVTTNGTAQTRTHGPTHELLTGAGQNVSTDVKGNITLIPSSLRPTSSSLLLNWDFDNRLSTADLGNNGSIDVTYRFDALGRRVYRQSNSGTTVYVQSGQQTIADYVAGTAPASPIYRYVYASYIDEPVMRFKPVGSERTYYHRNQQYSIVAVTGNTGAIQERYAYSAYGTPTITDSAGALRAASAVDNRITYTGREWDADLVLYHYRARLYDPTLGRFCSRDPIGYLAGSSLHIAKMDVRLLDPLGLDIWVENSTDVFGLHRRICVNTWRRINGNCCVKTGKFCITFVALKNGSGPLPGEVQEDNDPKDLAHYMYCRAKTGCSEDERILRILQSRVGLPGIFVPGPNAYTCRIYSESTFHELVDDLIRPCMDTCMKGVSKKNPWYKHFVRRCLDKCLSGIDYQHDGEWIWGPAPRKWNGQYW